MRKLFPLLCTLILTFMVSSCGDDEVDCTTVNLYEEVSAELNAVVATGQAYSIDPENADKCQAYKNALQNYLDALTPFFNCAQDVDEINTTLQMAEEDIDQIQC